MSKPFFSILFFMAIHCSVGAQQLANVFVSNNGKVQFKISVDKWFIMMNEQGKIQSIETPASGELVYNNQMVPIQAGDVSWEFNYQGWLSKLGGIGIVYDFLGRVNKIGELDCKYNYNQQIASIGSYMIEYNTNKSISQIGPYKIQYNYNGNLSKVDENMGLIVLQLNILK